MIEFLADSFERYDIDAVVADHFADNPASGAVLRKLGFQKTGESTGTSAARLEPAPVIDYLLDASDVRTRT
jgi:RimJ/RimL family protein N-acetyltransferase